ncbi:MAG: P-loop NTPase, partial [Eggerthellaceae bacterium]|nr:P-loop NTPase [Eggerthellaceae bacterium]
MQSNIPESLRKALRPVTLVVGHYGVGKTNFSVNLAIDLVNEGKSVTLVDLDIVNPYFRASEQRRVLEEHGVDLVAPVFAEAGSSLDVPSLTGRIAPSIEMAGGDRYVIVDVGGDDAGSVAVGRYARFVKHHDYAMLCVLNKYR